METSSKLNIKIVIMKEHITSLKGNKNRMIKFKALVKKLYECFAKET